MGQAYTQAIILDPTNSLVFGNRALCYVNTEQWEHAERDGERAIMLNPSMFKAHYYIGQALMGQGRYNEAARPLRRAYDLALEQKSPSLQAICESILRAKRESWERQERRRVREQGQMLMEVQQLLLDQRDRRIEQVRRQAPDAATDEIEAIVFDTNTKVRELQIVFEQADEKYRVRHVPEYVIDPISFSVMIDPVMTPSNRSFDRASILAHLRIRPHDPFSGEPLSEQDLRPNLALREVCEVRRRPGLRHG